MVSLVCLSVTWLFEVWLSRFLGNRVIPSAIESQTRIRMSTPRFRREVLRQANAGHGLATILLTLGNQGTVNTLVLRVPSLDAVQRRVPRSIYVPKIPRYMYTYHFCKYYGINISQTNTSQYVS